MGVKLTKAMIDGAKRTEELYGIPSSVTLGQIMLESGGSYEGGLSGLAYKYNNLFGVTAGDSWKGETVKMSNKAGTDTKTYRVYSSINESINDHGLVLSNGRYTKYTKKAKTVDEFVEGIAKGGYAEAPNYAEMLKSVIKNNNLTAYDGDTWQGKQSPSSPDTPRHDTPVGEGQEETDLKWWGDLIVVVLTVLLVGVALFFFLSAFGGVQIPGVSKFLPKGDN